MFVICLASSGMMNTPMWRHRAAPSFPKSERLWMQSDPKTSSLEAGD